MQYPNPTPPQPWGSRSYFYDKQIAYAFSYELRLKAYLDHAAVVPGGLRVAAQRIRQPGEGAPSGQCCFFHVLAEDSLRWVDGRKYDLPVGRVRDARETIVFRDAEGMAQVDGQIILATSDLVPVSVQYKGVLCLAPSPDASSFHIHPSFRGRGQVTLAFETTSPRYRWLTEHMFIAFGEVSFEGRKGRPATKDRPSELYRPVNSSFDVYITD
jgi:hypothetical protein